MKQLQRWAIAIGAAVVVAAGAAVIALFLLVGNAPESVNLSAAVEAAGTADSALTTSNSAASAEDDADLAGTWTLVSDGSSFVGYRVKEQLVNVGAVTAVGRTTSLEGTLTFDGQAITAVSVQADVSKLASDQTRRDMALQQQALQTSKYPAASFVLSQPIALDSVPAEGVTISKAASGALTLHGVTEQVSLELQGTYTSGRVVVVGSTEIVFADYGIAQPTSMSVLSIEDHGTMELQLVFARG
jgi:polyisoprenoid-binding protein YceI